jgi:hypothetical protein
VVGFDVDALVASRTGARAAAAPLADDDEDDEN